MSTPGAPPTRDGWAWVIAAAARGVSRKTRFEDLWDGLYVAACPACGQDTVWHAYSREAMCPCEEAV